MTTQLQIRNDTAANWTSSNPTLLAGEIGFETDTKKLKIGSGVAAWTALSYAPSGVEIFTATTVNANTVTATTVNANTVTATVGAGFQNMVVQTTGSSATYTLPAELQVTNAKFKVTIVGGGGQGGGTSTTAGMVGGGGGSGGVVVMYLTYVSGQNSATYTVGAAGSGAGTNAAGTAGGSSTFIYNAITYSAGGGVGGPTASSVTSAAGGTATGGTLNIAGDGGDSSGTMAATSNYQGDGGSTPFGFGAGGKMPATAAGATGVAASGYGAGGSGGRNGTGVTARAGGAGTAGLIIIEY